LLRALPDIKTINETKKLILKNASKSISPPRTVVNDGVVDMRKIRFDSDTVIPVASNAGGVAGPTIATLESGGRFDVAQLVIDDLKASINDAMFAKPLGDIDLPVKTATEIALRQQDLAKRIGSAFGRLQFELVKPLVRKILFILERSGLVDLGPFRIDGSFIDIEVVSPLAQAQEEEEFIAITRLLEFLANVYGPQSVLLITDPLEVIKASGDLLNVRESIIRPAEQIQELVEKAGQAAQQTGAAPTAPGGQG
jgi:hypothetical protein